MSKYLYAWSFLFVFGPANAALITESASFNPVLEVDGSSSSTELNFIDTGLISKVELFLDFTKCDDPISSTGVCQGSGTPFLNEIVFTLTSPSNTQVSLISENTYSIGNSGAKVGILFDDDAATTVGGSNLISGTFAPVGSLAGFIGESINGIWRLDFEDTVGQDPLSLNSWRIDITTDSQGNIPVPNSIALMSLALVGLRFYRRIRLVPISPKPA